MINFTEAFKGALVDYHDWLSTKRKDEHQIASFSELRGIFYNKLISKIKEIGENAYDIRKSLFPSDFSIEFEHPGAISKVTLHIDPSYAYHNPQRKELLSLIKQTLDSMESTVYYDAFEWKLEKIIKTLKV